MRIEGGFERDAPICHSQPRFVLLRHEIPQKSTADTWDGSHWDFMLETREKLLTFRLDTLPDASSSRFPQELPAIRIADHRPIYLNYEGEISGNRGHVRRVGYGSFSYGTLDTIPSTDELLGVEIELAGQCLRSPDTPSTLSATLVVPSIQVDNVCQLRILQWIMT